MYDSFYLLGLGCIFLGDCVDGGLVLEFRYNNGDIFVWWKEIIGEKFVIDFCKDRVNVGFRYDEMRNF